MGNQMTDIGQLDAVARHVVTSVPVFGSSVTVGEAVDSMRRHTYESAAVIALCDDGHLRGMVSVERLFATRDDTRLIDIAETDPPVVGPGVDQEVAAWRAVRYREGSLAVVDEDHRFVGLIPPSALLDVLLQEHDEDMARMGGYLKSSSLARNAAEEPVVRRFVHRMPWLLVGLVGAMLSIGIVSAFEERLEREVALAFFIPAVVYIADAVGALPWLLNRLGSDPAFGSGPVATIAQDLVSIVLYFVIATALVA